MPVACLAALAAISAGALPVRADFADAPCAGEVRPALGYVPGANAVRALRDIAADEVILAPPAGLLPDVRAGDTVYLVARVGTALVEREVVAVQPGRRGAAIFVRTPDGRMVSAPVAEDGR